MIFFSVCCLFLEKCKLRVSPWTHESDRSVHWSPMIGLHWRCSCNRAVYELIDNEFKLRLFNGWK